MGNGGLNLRRWIVVEGLDGSGKTTVASWIKEHYEARGERVLVQMHPSERMTGTLARRSLQNKGLHMYALSTLFYILDVLISVSRLKKWGREYDDIVFVRYVMGAAYLPRRYAKAGYDSDHQAVAAPKKAASGRRHPGDRPPPDGHEG